MPLGRLLQAEVAMLGVYTNATRVFEHQIVRAIEDGLSYKLVADHLGSSINTVCNHLRHIYAKLQLNSKLEALTALKRRNG